MALRIYPSRKLPFLHSLEEEQFFLNRLNGICPLLHKDKAKSKFSNFKNIYILRDIVVYVFECQGFRLLLEFNICICLSLTS